MGKGVRVRNTTVNGGLTGRDEQLGKVFAHKEGSSYSTMKKFTPAGNPNSLQQQAVRNVFALTSAGWSALTQAQRDLWIAAAPDWGTTGIFGDKKQSGKNLYTGCNVVLALAGKALITVPSAKAMVAGVTEAGLDSELRFTFEFAPYSAADTLQLMVSKPQSAGTSKCEKLVILKNVPCAEDGVEDVVDDYAAKFGYAGSGQKIFFEIRGISQGGNAISIIKGNIVMP